MSSSGGRAPAHPAGDTRVTEKQTRFWCERCQLDWVKTGVHETDRCPACEQTTKTSSVETKL